MADSGPACTRQAIWQHERFVIRPTIRNLELTNIKAGLARTMHH
jgi:hypothetical protein